MLKTGLFLAFLLYPSLSAKMLSVLNCKVVHGQPYLVSDIRIACYDATHNKYMIMGLLGIFLYAVGIPLAFLGLLFQYKVPSLAKHKRECHILSRAIIAYSSIFSNESNEEHALHMLRCATGMMTLACVHEHSYSLVDDGTEYAFPCSDASPFCEGNDTDVLPGRSARSLAGLSNGWKHTRH